MLKKKFSNLKKREKKKNSKDYPEKNRDPVETSLLDIATKVLGIYTLDPSRQAQSLAERHHMDPS